MAQQTAVEWFTERMILNGYLFLTQEEHTLYKELKQQAKEMEKQQIEEAWKRGDGEHDKVADKLAKQYYIKTYGNNTKNE
jgi:transcriptional regulator with PAS, ATPase and Fis domain